MQTNSQTATARRAKPSAGQRESQPPKTVEHQRQVQKIMAKFSEELAKLPHEKPCRDVAMYDEYGLPI